MQAAQIYEPLKVRLTEISVPEPGALDAIIEVGAVSFCGSDVSAFRGIHPRIRLPVIPGHEFAGTIKDVGNDVIGLTPGTRVAVEPNIRCGKCRYCARGLPNLCRNYRVLGEEAGLPGACSQLVRVPAANLHPLPDSVGTDVGALVQPLSIAYHAVVHRASVEAGQWILIMGAGAIGLGVLLVSKALGARCIVTDPHPYRLELASRLGASHVVNSTTGELDATVFGVTDDYGVHASFEAVGGNQRSTLDDCLRLTASDGRVVILGSFKESPLPIDIVGLKYRELQVIGSQGHPESFAPTIALISRGMPAQELISHRLPLAQAEDAIVMLHERRDNALKVILDPQ